VTSIVRYQKATDAHTTYTLATPPEGGCVELCTLADGYTYVAVPDGVTLTLTPPAQPAQIADSIEALTLTDELREQIKAASPHCQLIAQRMIEQIRARYSVDDELFYARIMIGAGAGLYVMTQAEFAEVSAFKDHVEAVREWGRAERASLGLQGA
jgi:hypothetical protein